MSKQALKLKKRKKREQANQRQKLAEEKRRGQHERRRMYRLNYPEFHFDATNGDPDFVQVVKKAVATIDLEDSSVFPPWQTELYRMLKQQGGGAVRDAFRWLKLECHETGDPRGRIAELQFQFTLGQAVLDRIPEAKREHYLPINDVMFVPKWDYIHVIFRSLMRASGPGGTIYYSRRKPMLTIGGQSKIVAFSIHAIQQACKRLKPRYKVSYAALGDIFSFFDQCRYFEQCELYGGQLAFTFYDECTEGFVQYRYVPDVLGEENLDPMAGKPHYRVGYCPAVIEGKFIKAKTLLFPGYASTPEYDAIMRSGLPWDERRQLIEKAKDLTADTLYKSLDFSLIKWFHDHGVPQVVQMDRHVFSPAA